MNLHLEKDTVANFTAIAAKVFEAGNFDPLADLLGKNPNRGHEYAKLDSLLRKVADSASDFSTGELVCYLRAAYSLSGELKEYMGLYNSAISIAKTRGDIRLISKEGKMVWHDEEDKFFGLIPFIPYKRMF